MELYFFDKGDFETGIEYLAKGTDGQLRMLARAKRKAGTDPQKIVKLADEWWELSAQNEKAREYAITLYQSVFDRLTGLTRKQVESRIGNQVVKTSVREAAVGKIWNLKWTSRSNRPAWTKLSFSWNGEATYTIRNQKIKNQYQVVGDTIRLKGTRNPNLYVFHFDSASPTVKVYDVNSSLVDSGTLSRNNPNKK